MPRLLPILHAGGFSWDEAIILVIAIVAVPALSWFMGRVSKHKTPPPDRARQRRARDTGPTSDEIPPVE